VAGGGVTGSSVNLYRTRTCSCVGACGVPSRNVEYFTVATSRLPKSLPRTFWKPVRSTRPTIDPGAARSSAPHVFLPTTPSHPSRWARWKSFTAVSVSASNGIVSALASDAAAGRGCPARVSFSWSSATATPVEPSRTVGWTVAPAPCRIVGSARAPGTATGVRVPSACVSPPGASRSSSAQTGASMVLPPAPRR
jgi:hypothetical protein